MPHKYAAEFYNQGRISSYNHVWRGAWFCREFAQQDIHSMFTGQQFKTRNMVMKIAGANMRARDLREQEGMAKFGSLLLPDYPITVSGDAIWVNSLMGRDDRQIYPAKEVWSLLLFYIKNLSIQMKDRVDFEKVCKTLIKRKHRCFRNLPDQQLGTALYFFAYVKYPKEMLKYRSGLSVGNGPGTAMRCLADLEDAEVGKRVPASEFYWAMIDEWCSLFKKELRYIVDFHVRPFERYWYMPLLIQDVYDQIYDTDGKFDGIEYGDDEW